MMSKLKKLSIYSMTGFGSANCDRQTYKISTEIKSVNNRYKDISIHLPLALRTLEPIINKQLNEYTLRGKIDVFVNFIDKSNDSKSLLVDKQLVSAYQKALTEIAGVIDPYLAKKEFSMNEIIALSAYPGILTREDSLQITKEIEDDLNATLKGAMNALLTMKATEGENLYKDIIYRLNIIKEKNDALCKLASIITEKYRHNLLNTLEQYLQADKIDQTRVIQETALYAEKINYTEETTRLQSHLNQFMNTLHSTGNIGRKLDFIIQEMNRESNTIASKANCAEATILVVDVKSEIEKIREQIQNIE